VKPKLHIGVLALQGAFAAHAEALRKCGAEVRLVRTQEDLSGLHGIVIPGGESTTMSNLLVASGLSEVLKGLCQDGFPVFGTCAGMIMLANQVSDARTDQEFIGGIDMSVRRNAFGSQIDSFEMDLEVQGIGGVSFPAVFIRAPWVEEVGPEVQILSTIAKGPRAGKIVAVQQGPLLATSFHPELTGDIRIHATFVEIVRQYA
jgi:5'-phosphate synthase pdxT subunit